MTCQKEHSAARYGTGSGNTTREETLGTNSRQRLGKRKDLVLFSTTRLRIAFGSDTESADRRADFPSSLTVDGTFRPVDWHGANGPGARSQPPTGVFSSDDPFSQPSLPHFPQPC